MKTIHKFLAGLVLTGLLAVGVFSFGEQGVLKGFLKLNPSSQATAEPSNKITVAEITNEKEIPLDNSKSAVVLNTFISTADNDLVFDHLLNAREFEGVIVSAGDDPTGLRLKVKAPVNLASAELPEAVSRHETTFSKHTVNHLGNDYPTMVLTASSLRKIKGNLYALRGLFSLHGVSRSIHVPVILEVTGNLIQISGELAFLQSDYSIKPYNTPSRTAQNEDRVVLKFDLSAAAE